VLIRSILHKPTKGVVIASDLREAISYLAMEGDCFVARSAPRNDSCVTCY
jgi:hypothetical protein